MGCKKLTYNETLSPLKVVCSNLNISGISCVGSYRYGFNGMEKDDNVKGEGNSYTTEFRQYDPRVGRWLSIDPLFKNFPWQSPYVAFDNNPIYYKDPKGLAAEGGDEPVKKGDKFTGDDGKEYSTTHEEAEVFGEVKSELAKKANEITKKVNELRILLTEPPDNNARELYETPPYIDQKHEGKKLERLPFGESTEYKEREWDDDESDPLFGGYEHGGTTVGPKNNYCKDCDSDMYIGDRLRRTNGWSDTVPVLNGWRLDSVFYDKVTDRKYTFPLEEMDTVTGKKKTYNISPRKW